LIYWDTSCALKLYVRESDSELWEERAVDCREDLVASALLEAELAYALIRKESLGDVRPGGADALLARFRRDVEWARFTLYPVGTDVLHTAVELANRCVKVGKSGAVRTLDGIHLATAQLLKCSAVATADRRMRAAAESLGIPLV
jgi:predicted nucleic acid-binding protein